MDFSKGAVKTTIPAPLDDEYREVAWAIPEYSANPKFEPTWINRPNPQDFDVKFEMLYCGICHSDCHIGLNHMAAWRPCHYPFVGGHELLGRVVEVGSKVTKVKVGEAVGVGCFVDACLDCENCEAGNENYCAKGLTPTYNGDRAHGRYNGNPASKTWGGYSGSNVVNENFILKIPDSLPLEFSAPIMCAGITMYSPLRDHGATAGKKMTIGVIGVGGLGTMGIKLAAALGHDVVAISTSPSKEEAARKKGATHYVVSTDPESVLK
jgi:alcohol dehydrogenase (NADP+)